MEAVCPSETSLNLYQSTRRHIPEQGRNIFCYLSTGYCSAVNKLQVTNLENTYTPAGIHLSAIFCLLKGDVFAKYEEQEVPGRTNRLFSFDTTRTT
jgi:hypothetical protein